MIEDPEREKVLPLIRHWLNFRKGDVVLDIGCGDVFFCKSIAAEVSSANVIGCDIQIKRVVHTVNLTYLVCDAQHLPFRGNSINKIIMNHVLEHLPSGKLAFDEISRVLIVGGRAFIATPNSYEDMLKLFRPLAHRVDEWEGHLKHFSMDEFRKMSMKRRVKILHHHYAGFFGLFLYYSLLYFIFKPLAGRSSTTGSRCLTESSLGRSSIFHNFLLPLGKAVLFMLGRFDDVFKNWSKGMGIHLVVSKNARAHQYST